jgi:hypothetical protein
MKKARKPSSRPQQNKDRLSQGTQQSPQEHLKAEILQKITENFMEMLLDKVNQNVQEALKKFQETKLKNIRRHKNK